MTPTVSVVVPNFNGARLLAGCLGALAAQERQPDEVLVVDNGSTDRSLELLARDHPDVRVLALARNHGFAGGANRGVQATRGDRVAILNSDARPEPSWLRLLLTAPDEPELWEWGGALVSPTSGTVESAGDHYSPRGYAYKLFRGRSVDELPGVPYRVFAAPGAAPLVRREVFAELGGYEERFFLYYEDIDLAFRALLRGYRALVVPAARVDHDLGASSTMARVRFHVARNQLWTAVRCLPEPRLRVLLARWRAELPYNRPLTAELRGRAAGLAGLPWALRTRREIQAARVLEPEEVLARLAEPQELISRA